LFVQVSANQDINRMGTRNLAMCWFPVLIGPLMIMIDKCELIFPEQVRPTMDLVRMSLKRDDDLQGVLSARAGGTRESLMRTKSINAGYVSRASRTSLGYTNRATTDSKSRPSVASEELDGIEDEIEPTGEYANEEIENGKHSPTERTAVTSAKVDWAQNPVLVSAAAHHPASSEYRDLSAPVVDGRRSVRFSNTAEGPASACEVPATSSPPPQIVDPTPAGEALRKSLELLAKPDPGSGGQQQGNEPPAVTKTQSRGFFDTLKKCMPFKRSSNNNSNNSSNDGHLDGNGSSSPTPSPTSTNGSTGRRQRRMKRRQQHDSKPSPQLQPQQPQLKEPEAMEVPTK
jgi:hypothetical protein